MGAKSPRITPAQRELEALQLRTLAEQEREQNLEGARTALTQRRLMLGQLGYNQFLNPQSQNFYRATDPADLVTQRQNLPAAQAAGTLMAPDLADPATAALERRERMMSRATGFGSTFMEATQALALRRRV